MMLFARSPRKSRAIAKPGLRHLAGEGLEDRCLLSISPTTGDVLINTTIAGNQQYPSVAMDGSGNYVVTWTSTQSDTGDIYAQRYTAAGATIGSEFRVNTTTAGAQQNSAVAMSSAGDFVVVWTGLDANAEGLFAQRYDAAGVAQGGEFQVNTYTQYSQNGASVGMDSAGNFVIAWQSGDQDVSSGTQDSGYYGVFAKRYNAAGVALDANDVQINPTSGDEYFQGAPSIAVDPSGNYVVTYTDASLSGLNIVWNVYARRYNSAGVLQPINGSTNQFRVNTTTATDTNRWISAVAIDGSGNFTIVWEDNRENKNETAPYNDVYMRRFSSSGTPLISETKVNTFSTYDQTLATIAMDSSGNYIVTWQSGDQNNPGNNQDGSDFGVYAQRYTSAGVKDGGEFRVNSFTNGYQAEQRVALGPSGAAIIVYTSAGQDGSGRGVYAKRYVSPNVAPTSPGVGGPYAINQGDALVLAGLAASDPEGQPLAYSWSINGQTFATTNVNGLTPTVSWSQLTSLGITGPGTFALQVRADDGWGGVTTSSSVLALTVNNAPPVITSDGGPYFITEGNSLSLFALATDTGPLTYGWDLTGANNNFDNATGASATVTWSQLVALGINQATLGSPRTIRLRVTDSLGASTISTTQLNVFNGAPSASAGGPYTMAEGSALNLSGSGVDPSPVATLSYAWDLDGNNDFNDAFGASPTVPWSQLVGYGYANGPGSFNVRVRVSDNLGAFNDSTAVAVTINNVAPTANAGGPYSINEGDGLTLAGSGSDPVDAITYAWDLNNDGIYTDATGAAPTISWSQLVGFGHGNGPGGFTAKLRVTDGDGAATDSTASVTINNVAPTANAGGPYTINAGDPLTLGGSGSDPVDAITYAWDLNNDGNYTDATGAAPTIAWSQLAGYGYGPGSFTAKLRVTDTDGAATDSSATVTINDVTPTANAGGPYVINEGSSLALNGSGTDPLGLGLTYSWDVNGDGTFGDATGASPTLTWAQLVALGIVSGPASFNAALRVTTATLQSADGTTTLTVNNVAPTASVAGPATAVRGQSQSFTFSATDPSAADAAAGFTFTIDWGDGSAPETVTGPSGTTVAHAFALSGNRTVSVTATDTNGGVSGAATTGVAVSSAQLLPNAQNSALADLVWAGTDETDRVVFEQVDATTIRVTETMIGGVATSVSQLYSGVTGRLRATGAAGNDTLTASAVTSTQATLDGGAGNNTLFGGQAGDILIGGSNGGEGAQGSNTIIAGNGNNTIYGNAEHGYVSSTGGNNLIVGGSGSDTIYGAYKTVTKLAGTAADGAEGGQNLIVGGGGADSIHASQQADGAEGGKGSIVVSGSTTLSQSALTAVLSEWTSTRDFATKKANISGTGTGPRNNGSNFLQAGATVNNDSAIDQVFSDTNGKENWFFYTFAEDSASRVKATDTSTDLP